MAAMEQVKRSLLRYLGNDRDKLNELTGHADDQAVPLGLSADEHDAHVLDLLTRSNALMYARQQKNNRGKPLLKVGTELPPFQSQRDPFALEDAALLDDDAAKARLQTKHVATIRIVCQVANKLGASTDKPYTFLKHTESLYQATLDIWAPDSLEQCRSDKTWSKHMCKLLQFMNMIGEPTAPLYALFKDAQLYAEDHTEAAPPKQRTVSPEESAQLRELTKGEFFPQAMEVLDHPQIAEFDEHTGPGTPIGRIHRMKAVHDAIAVLYLYGSTSEHTLQRRDLVGIEFKTMSTDPDIANFVEIKDGKVTITLNSLHKVKPGNKRATMQKLDEALLLDVSRDNPLFAELLVKYEPVCAKIHSDGPAYLLFMYDKAERWGRKMQPTNLTTRNKRVYKGAARGGLIDPELAARAGGVNRARNAAQANTMQQDLPAPEEIERSREMGRTGRAGMVTGRESYNRDRQDRVQGELPPGAMVSVCGLSSPRSQHLNDSCATVIEWLPAQDRYRVQFLHDGSRGMLRASNLILSEFGDLLLVQDDGGGEDAPPPVKWCGKHVIFSDDGEPEVVGSDHKRRR